MSTSSYNTLKNTYKINTDILEGSTIFVEQDSALQWNTNLMSSVWIYNGNENSSFKTISFQTTNGTTQVLLGFAVYDAMGTTLISQIGAKGRFNILNIQNNTNLSQYTLTNQEDQDKYATNISVGTNGNKFEMNFTPQSDLVIVPVVSDLGYTIVYECTGVNSTNTLKSGYSANYVANQSKYYPYRLTCMSYSVDNISAQWDCFSVSGYYDKKTSINVASNYCPDSDSQVVTYTLTHNGHNYSDLKYANRGHYSTSDYSCMTYDWYECLYCKAETEKEAGIKHRNPTKSTEWSYDATHHWHKVTCTNKNCTDPYIRDEDKGSHASAGWYNSDKEQHHCKTCGYKEDHDWTDYVFNKEIDCLTDEYISKCKVCEKTRTEKQDANNHKYNEDWKEGTELFKDDSKLKDKVRTYYHIKYKTCSVCNSHTFRIAQGSSIDDCIANNTLSGWNDAVRSKVGYDMVRFCPCGGKQTHTHGATLGYTVTVTTNKNATNGYWKFDDDGTACKADISFYNITVSCYNCPKPGGLSTSLKYAVISNETKHYVSQDTISDKILKIGGQAANAVIEAGVTIWNKLSDAVVKLWNKVTGQDVENSTRVDSSAVAKIPFICEKCAYTVLNPLLNVDWTIDKAGWKLKDYLIKLERKEITKYSDEFAKFLPKETLWDSVIDYINRHYL